MVYYFTSDVVDPPVQIYVGKDKFENEHLIKYGLEQDVWVRSSPTPAHIHFSIPTRPQDTCSQLYFCQFHVDNLSSAHVYYRLADDQTWDRIPQEVLVDCAQLTKANSIDGNKKDNVTIIYTPWSNLKKDGSMAVGQVGFKDQKKVKKIFVETRLNPVVNRLNKTRVERFPDLAQEKDDALREVRTKEQVVKRDKKKEEDRVARERREKAWQRDHMYDDLHSSDRIAQSSNQDRDEGFLDDFM